MITSKRICAGEYAVYDNRRPTRIVRVTKVYYPNDGEYWIAAPQFDNNTSDPQPTKRDALRSAAYFLNNY